MASLFLAATAGAATGLLARLAQSRLGTLGKRKRAALDPAEPLRAAESAATTEPGSLPATEDLVVPPETDAKEQPFRMALPAAPARAAGGGAWSADSEGGDEEGSSEDEEAGAGGLPPAPAGGAPLAGQAASPQPAAPQVGAINVSKRVWVREEAESCEWASEEEEPGQQADAQAAGQHKQAADGHGGAGLASPGGSAGAAALASPWRSAKRGGERGSAGLASPWRNAKRGSASPKAAAAPAPAPAADAGVDEGAGSDGQGDEPKPPKEKKARLANGRPLPAEAHEAPAGLAPTPY